MLDAAEANRTRPKMAFDTIGESLFNCTLTRIQNNSGADRNRFDVLGLDVPLITPTNNLDEFQRSLAFSGVAPVAGTHEDLFCVLLEPIANGGIGIAAVAGSVPVQVTGAAKSRAEIQNSSTVLAMSATGSARVLWADSGTGTRWARVRFGDGATSAAFSGAESSADLVTLTTPQNGIAFTSNDFDTDSYWSSSPHPSRLTVPKTGYYRAVGGLDWLPNASPFIGWLYFGINGTSGTTQRESDHTYVVTSGLGAFYQRSDFVTHLNSGDYVELFATTSANPQTIQGATLAVYFLGS